MVRATCEQSEFTDGRHGVSPDSEQIEPTVTVSQKVKLCERGVNLRECGGFLKET